MDVMGWSKFVDMVTFNSEANDSDANWAFKVDHDKIDQVRLRFFTDRNRSQTAVFLHLRHLFQ